MWYFCINTVACAVSHQNLTSPSSPFRECVQTLRSRDTWIKEGRCVRPRQDPYKVVTARPKWDRMTGTVIKDRPLEIFGFWQTDVYEAPPAENGKVPRNEYGNVELFKPWMLPKGTVHLPIEGGWWVI